MKAFLAIALASQIALAQAPLADRITARISVDSLRGHVSFLASDVLAGRGTPSPGLESAARYIAAEFQRAGLAAPTGDDFFQPADFVEVIDHPGTVRFSLTAFAGSRDVPADRVTVLSLHGANLVDEPVFKWTPGVKVDSLAGKILVLRTPTDSSLVRKLAFSHPDAIVQLDRVEQPAELPRLARLVPADKKIDSGPSVLAIPETELEAIFERLPNGVTNARASLHIDTPETSAATLRNVAGMLRGSDPVLRDQYILISAHYDHLGVTTSGTGGAPRTIYSGANDNASGVATVIELARAFALENPRPKRTLVFLCFFGEEEGLLGSQYYVHHPLYPLANTIADINFEQLGRPEKTEGLRENSLGVTGSEYSSLPQILGRAAKPLGVILRQTRDENEFFDRSDNYAFALAGIPAHTFLAAFDYPDYHQPSDKWPALDYDNMARLDRALAAGILDLANRAEPPKWNENNAKARDFVVAWRALHP